MRVLVTGAGGQLGRTLLDAFADEETVGLTHSALDVTDEAAVAAALDEHNPDLVVHAAAYTSVDACEQETERAWRVNTLGSWWIARACARTGAALVYPSTDYVFDGRTSRPYTEFDRPNPQSVYGRSKEAGEQLVRGTLGRHFIVRTSWVHGVHGRNFAKAVLARAREGRAVSVVDDQTGSPTFAVDLAGAIRELVASDRPGTYHLTNQGYCTWFEFALAIFEAAGVCADLTPTTTAAYGAPAPRPPFSVLDNHLGRLTGLTPLPHWRESLAGFMAALADAHGSPDP